MLSATTSASNSTNVTKKIQQATTSFFVPAGNLAGSILTSFMACLNMSWLVTKLTKFFTCGLSNDGVDGVLAGPEVKFGGGASSSYPDFL